MIEEKNGVWLASMLLQAVRHAEGGDASVSAIVRIDGTVRLYVREQYIVLPMSQVFHDNTYYVQEQ